MELELKHLSPYLPYDLKVMAPYEDRQIYSELILLSKSSGYCNVRDARTYAGDVSEYKIEAIKPILRPLSDITNEHLQELFRKDEVAKIKKLISQRDWQQYQDLDYSTILFFCVNHYDFQGLIDKGLAIDINTLNKND